MSEALLENTVSASLVSTRASWLIRRLFARLRRGRLTLVLPSGRRLSHLAAAPGPEGELVLHRWRALRLLLLSGNVRFAESYLDGDWDTPDLPALIEFAACNADGLARTVQGSLLSRVRYRWLHGRNANTKVGSRRNITFHYDLGNAFYAAWLDPGMTYSSGIYPSVASTLEEAQTEKQDRVMAGLQLEGGERVLEIGFGWGGLAERLISETGCHVTGLTLSNEQHAYARQRLRRSGLEDRADLRLQDYRDVTGSYDRIVSIEMLEAVGEAYWPSYFGVLRDRLKPGGRAVLQVITIDEDQFVPYRRSPDFIQHYIFPGGLLPTRTLLRDQAAAAGLVLTSAETFAGCYARTLADWRLRFHAAWPTLAALGFSERFRRMWEYYLGYCEGGFRAGRIDVGLYVLQPAAQAGST